MTVALPLAARRYTQLALLVPAPRTARNDFLISTAFQVQALNTPGDASRDVAWSPGLFNVDISLGKPINVTERELFELRLEAFNSTNHTNFGNPGTTFGSSSFGVISSTVGNNRIAQMAIRFQF